MSIKIIDNQNGVYRFEGLSTDTKGTGSLTDENGNTIKYKPFSELLDEKGKIHQYQGATPGWKVTSIGGVSYAMDNFRPSSYTGKITSAEDGTTFAIASGATKLLLQSLEVTGLEEFAVLAFGTSAADAQTNLTKTGTTPNIISTAGVVIRSADSTAGGVSPDQVVGIPANATHAAIGNGVAATTQVIMVTQGV